MPTASAHVIRPGTAPTVRPSSAAKSAVVSEPERSAASTTTVTYDSAAMMRLRATKHQRIGPKPGRELRHDAAALARPRRRASACSTGTATSAPHASTATTPLGASSAPVWAAESIPSASPDTIGTPAADSPRPSARGDLEAVRGSPCGRRRSRRRRPPRALRGRRRRAAPRAGRRDRAAARGRPAGSGTRRRGRRARIRRARGAGVEARVRAPGRGRSRPRAAPRRAAPARAR